jgi:hypothetical protein
VGTSLYGSRSDLIGRGDNELIRVASSDLIGRGDNQFVRITSSDLIGWGDNQFIRITSIELRSTLVEALNCYTFFISYLKII